MPTFRRSSPAHGERLARLKSQVDRPLTAILTLNTMANTMGTYLVGKEFGQLALRGGWGGWTEGAAAGVLCIAILLLGEITPKIIGATYWRQLAPAVSVALVWMSILTAPVIWFIQLFRPGAKHRNDLQPGRVEGHGGDRQE